LKRPHLSFSQKIIHGIVLAGFWGLYLAGLTHVWISPKYIFEGLEIILGAEFILLLTLTMSWIKYHLILHRAKGPRTHIPIRSWKYDYDWLGYEVVADFKALKEAHFIVVQICPEEKKKVYHMINYGKETNG